MENESMASVIVPTNETHVLLHALIAQCRGGCKCRRMDTQESLIPNLDGTAPRARGLNFSTALGIRAEPYALPI